MLDGSGLGAQLAQYRSLALRGGALVMVAPPPHVQAVLELRGLGTLVPVVASEARALAQEPDLVRGHSWNEPPGLRDHVGGI